MSKNKDAGDISLDFQETAKRVSLVTILVNVMLSLIKLFAGLFAHSSAMVSDAVNSISDVFSTFVVLIGIKLASKAPDKEHPYGHERLECVAAILLAVVLLLTGLGIGIKSLNTIISGEYNEIEAPGVIALVAAVVSIVVKEAMYRYARYYAKKIDSAALMATAWDHRSDALSSTGALIGIAGARMGFPILDSIASLVIFLFIAKAAFEIFRDAMNKMVDHSCDEDTEKQIRDCVMANEQVMGIDLLRTRVFGNRIYVDIEISMDASRTLREAHDIAQIIHDDIERTFSKVKHIMVHVNPADIEQTPDSAQDKH